MPAPRLTTSATSICAAVPRSRRALEQHQSLAATALARVDRARASSPRPSNLAYTELRADLPGVVTLVQAEVGRVWRRARAWSSRPHRRTRNPGRRAGGWLSGARGQCRELELWSDPGRHHRVCASCRQRRSDDPHLSGASASSRRVHRARHDRDAAFERPDGAPGRVPLSAIFQRGTQPAVWVVDRQTGTVTLRPVTVARWRDEQAAIASGVRTAS